MTETCEKHRVERCLTCFAHVPGSAAAPEREKGCSTEDSPCMERGCPRCDGIRDTQAHVRGYEQGFKAAQEYAAAPSGPGLREVELACIKLNAIVKHLNIAGAPEHTDLLAAVAEVEKAAEWARFHIEERGKQNDELRAALAAHPEVPNALPWTALEKIRHIPTMPFPDPGAHSWHAFGEAVLRAYCDIQRIASDALATPTSAEQRTREQVIEVQPVDVYAARAWARAEFDPQDWDMMIAKHINESLAKRALSAEGKR